MTSEIELLVVGGGPAGVTAAIQARQLGARVTLLEADQVGGTNLNRGPGPVRTLARSARLARDWTSWSTFGLEGPPPRPNLEAILANSDRVARHTFEKKHLADQLRRNGIDLVEHLGSAHFTDPYTLTAHDGRAWRAERIIVAVGGHAGRLAIPGSELALTYSDLRALTALPAAAAVVGAADTGCQIASILSDLGTHVSLFEAGPAIVPNADPSISVELEQAFERQGIETHTNTMVNSIRSQEDRLHVEHATSSEVAETVVDAVFFAVGWPPNIEQLALEAAGIRPQRQGIPVDAYLRTEVDHIFAPGDVNGRSMLVQVARLEGRVAAQNAIMGPDPPGQLRGGTKRQLHRPGVRRGRPYRTCRGPPSRHRCGDCAIMTTCYAQSRTATRRDSASSSPTDTTRPSSVHTCWASTPPKSSRLSSPA